MQVYPAQSVVFVLRHFERVDPSTVDFCFDVSHQTIKETRQAMDGQGQDSMKLPRINMVWLPSNIAVELACS